MKNMGTYVHVASISKVMDLVKYSQECVMWSGATLNSDSCSCVRFEL